MRRILIKGLILFALVTLATSCSKEDAKQVSTSDEGGNPHVSTNSAGGKSEIGSEDDLDYGKDRKIYKFEKKDLNGDKTDEIIVLSVNTSDPIGLSDVTKFDRIEIFVLDSVRSKYVRVISDTVDFGVECTYADMNGSGEKQIFISTNSGGNNEVASKGMVVYGVQSNDSVGRLKYFEGGSPSLIKSGNSEVSLLAVTDLFHGVMPMAYAVPYTSALYELKDGELVVSNEAHASYFDDKLKEALDKYYGLKRKVEMGMQPMDLSYPLYREAAEVIVNYKSKGDVEGLKKFWMEEKESLKRILPDEEFADLSNFIGKILPADQNA